MNANYWESFWRAHARRTEGQDPQTQVLRTLHQRPLDAGAWTRIVSSVTTMLAPDSGDALLDLCCGNGVLTRQFFDRFRTITAVDLAENFVTQVASSAPTHVTAIAGDARTIQFPEASFDRILLYAGLQYFSEQETVDLLARLRLWIRGGGRVVIGDIPDVTRRWHFFNTPEREAAYFESLRSGAPVVGNWFDPSWLEKLGRHVGFAQTIVSPQPESLPYHHYRFDLLLRA